jgi:PAS domain S-box-containing protein
MPAKAKKKATAIARENKRLERQLRRRVDELEREREFIRTVVDSTPALFCVMDTDLRVLRCNDAFEKLLGIAGVDNPRGELFHELFVAPGESADVKRRLLNQADEVEHESAFRRADGSDAIVAWIKRRVTDSEGRPCIFFSGVDVTTRRQEQEQLRASRARIVQAGDAARHRIERDLHDGAQQRLVSVSLALSVARGALKEGRVSAAAKQLGTIEAELAEALEELRELARGIHPAVLTDRGLPAALEALAVRSRVPVEIEQAPQERLSTPVEAAVYYLVAEALTNVAKYARARVASVRVFRQDAQVVAEVEDDGIGGAELTAGTGLRGLSDRVEALDGELQIESPKGGPTILRATIPAHQVRASTGPR